MRKHKPPVHVAASQTTGRETTSTKNLLFVLLAVLALVAAACGSSSSDTSTDADTSTTVESSTSDETTNDSTATTVADAAAEKAVRNAFPGAPPVLGAPYPASGGPEVKEVPLAGHAGYGSRTPAPERADQAVLHGGVEGFRIGGGSGLGAGAALGLGSHGKQAAGQENKARAEEYFFHVSLVFK